MASPEKSLGKSKPKSKKSKKTPKHRIRSMHISPTDNDGFVATHDYHPGEPDENGMSQTPPSTTHALASPDDLLSHVQSNFGGGAGQAGAGAMGGM